MFRHPFRPASCLTAALSLLLLSASASAAVPKTVQIHGAVRAVGGGPVSDGGYESVVSLYDQEQGGSAIWSEAMTLTVKGGAFSALLGLNKPLNAKVFEVAAATWLGLKVGADPELARARLHSTVFAMVAERAAVALSAQSAETATKAGSADSAKVADLAKGLACTGCVSLSALKMDGDLDLGGNALKAKQVAAAEISATVVNASSFVGDGSKLTGIKTPAGSCAKAGEVVKGIGPDGSLFCVQAMDPAALPADGLDEISNNQLTTQFVDDVVSATAPKPIPDNNPIGLSDEIDFPDLGLAQKLTVYIEVSNSDMSQVRVELFDPDNAKLVLYDKGGAGKSLKTSYPAPSKPVSGDLGAWVGKNPKGKWRLKVIDGGFTNNTTDGQLVGWHIAIQTLSNKQVAANGNLLLGGDLAFTNKGQARRFRFENAPAPPDTCDASNRGLTYYNTKEDALYVCNGKQFRLFAKAASPGSQTHPAASCKAILAEEPNKDSGLYWLLVAGQATQVYCDMKTAGGGWTLVFQRRGGAKNVEAFGANLNAFVHGKGGSPAKLGYGDSYSLGVDNAPSHAEWLFLDIADNDAVDADDAFIIHHAGNLFPNTVGAVNIAVSKVCNVANAGCDATEVYFKFLGNGHFSGSTCNSGLSASYGGNYGYCHNGLGGYASNSLYGNRNGYAETKLWSYTNTGYRERVFVR